MNENLYELIRSRFPEDGSKPFLQVTIGENLLYGELENETSRVAGLLRSLNVEKGERVAVQIDKSTKAVVLYLACLRVGAVYLPLNTAYTANEVSYFLENAEPQLVVCRPETVDQIEPIAKKAGVAHILTMSAEGLGSFTDQSSGAQPDSYVEQMQADDLAAILYTSGTTGRSKGAMLTHKNLSSNALSLHKIWGWQEGDVLLHALPIFHVHGLFVALHCALLNGSTVLYQLGFKPEMILKLLPEATVMMGVPTFYTRLLDTAGFTSEVCSNIRLFVSGSAPLLVDTFNSFETRTGHRILERYGMSEAGMITSNPLDGDREPGTVGYPLPDVQVRTSELGVLEIIGPNVFKGYWRMPEKTDEEFLPDGWFITGDLCEITDEGRVSIVGRSKDLIISGGYNIYPKEIENEIDLLDGVVESAVIGVFHPDFGETVVAVVVTTETASTSEAKIIAGLDGKLARFKLPRRVFLVDELPRNAMGKVGKATLREQHDSLFR